MRVIYYFKKDIRTVTGYYYGIILKGLQKVGCQTVPLDSYRQLKNTSKDSYILITTYDTYAYLLLKGFNNLIFWYQGLTPEEDYQRTKSHFRRFAYSFFEKISLKRIRYRIFVSKYQIEYFKKKYGIELSPDECFIMPCFNSEFNKDNFHIKDKYNHNLFCYSGGIQEYQGFDIILKTFKDIEMRHSDAFLKIYSFDIDKAKEMVKDYGIKNCSVARLAPQEVDAALAQCKFGFILRDDNIINQVATPTKLTNYLGNGVIPIMTSTIKAYADIASHFEHIYCFDDDNKTEVIEKAISSAVSPELLEKEYHQAMNKFFNPLSYANRLSEWFKGLK